MVAICVQGKSWDTYSSVSLIGVITSPSTYGKEKSSELNAKSHTYKTVKMLNLKYKNTIHECEKL